MRAATVFTVVLAATLQASAQDILAALTDSSPSTSSADNVVTMTEYYDDCPSSSGASYSATVTGTIVSTYCPKCEMPESTSAGVFTTYTTEYSQLCPTGLEPVTYTVTESCSSTGASREATYVPQGFTVTTVQCTVCENMPMVTITTPTATQSTGPSAAPTISTAPAAGITSPAAVSAATAATPITTAAAETGTFTVDSSPAETGAPGAPAEAPAGSNSTAISPPINYSSGSNPRLVIDSLLFGIMALIGAFYLAI